MITSFHEDIPNSSKRSQPQNYEIVYAKLNDFIDKVNQKIVNRIHLVQQVYLEDYKQQVSIMAAELHSIRGVLDEETLKQRSNEKMYYLEQQRDFFRAQVIKLNEDLKKIVEENKKMKLQLSQVKEQSANFKKLVYDLQTKIYKLTYQNIQIQRLKEESRQKNLTMATATPGKGFQTERSNKLQSKTKQNNSVRKSSDENESGLAKQKTQYSLRKLKPAYSLAATMTNMHHKQSLRSLQPSSREQILDQCIKQLKKEIYYRNLNTKQANKIHFDEQNNVSFDKFTKSDKKQLVYRFMSNPQILQQFYKFVFLKQKTNQTNGKESQDVAFEKIALAKGIDAKYNTKMLINFKAEFDKRIYDIKSNRF